MAASVDETATFGMDSLPGAVASGRIGRICGVAYGSVRFGALAQHENPARRRGERGILCGS